MTTETERTEDMQGDDSLALIDRWLHGQADETECAVLLERIEKDKKLGEQAASNLLVDFLLAQRYETLKKTQSVFASILDSQAGGESVPIIVPCYIEEDANRIFPRLFNWRNWTSSGKRSKTKFVRGFSTADRDRRRAWPGMFILMTIVVLFIGIGTWMAMSDGEEEEFVALAKVVETIDPQWAPDSVNLRRGQDSGPNQLKLLGGFVKLRFVNGTEMTLTGPTDLTINSSFETFCRSGKASVHVSPMGRGFKIITPHGTAIDRGTNFFIEVDSNEMELGVVQGQVDLSRSAEKVPGSENPKNVLSLRTGEAVRKSLDTAATVVEYSSLKYIDESNFRRLLSDYAAKEEAKRTTLDKQVNSDPGLLARFDFTQRSGNRVENCSQRQSGCSELFLLRANSAEGSVYGRKATLFNSARGRGTLTLPGSWRSMTLFAKVRIDRLENWSNIVFSSGEADMVGSFVWQISKTGELYFFIREKSEKRGIPLRSGPVFKRRVWGGWYTIAVTIDAENQKITHYVDGDPVASFPWTKPVELAVGSATIGNVSPADRSSNPRALKGAFEDFRIYDRVLSAEELQEYAK